MANSTLSTIEKLRGRDNYASWKFAIQAYLEMHGLWQYVDGTVKKEDIKTSEESKAKGSLILSVDAVNYAHIQSATTATEVWDNLKKAFDDSGVLRRVGLLRELVSTRLENCKSMEEFVNKIVTTAYKLKGVGLELNDELVGAFMLAGLSEEYMPMIMAIENSNTTISADLIKNKLLQEVKSSSNSISGTSAMVSRAYGTGGRKNRKPKFKCYGCGELGHKKPDCPKRNIKKDNIAIMSCYTVSHLNSNDWFIDSGASAHMTNNRDLLMNIRPVHAGDVTVADYTRLKVECSGDVKLNCTVNGKMFVITVTDVLYVPGLCTNLLSVSQMVDKGLTVKFAKDNCSVIDVNCRVIGKAVLVNGMFKMNQVISTALMANSNINQLLWHRRLGHIGQSSLVKLKRGLVEGVNFNPVDQQPCEICIKGKHSRHPFGKSDSRATGLLQLIHTDLCGPMLVDSIGGSRYILTLIDDYSRKLFVIMIRRKSDAANKIKEFVNFVEKQTGKKVKAIRSDNGTEYINNNLAKFMLERGIEHQQTAPYTPEQNGLAERFNRTLVEKARCMLFDSGLDVKFWGEAVNTAAYIINRSPSKALANKTPEEMWTGKKPNLTNIRVFGCKAMMHIPKSKRAKFDPKSKEVIMLGYSGSKSYRVYDMDRLEVVISRDVIFFEDQRCSNELNVCDSLFSNNFYLFADDANNENEVEDVSNDANNGSIQMLEDNSETPTIEQPLDDLEESGDSTLIGGDAYIPMPSGLLDESFITADGSFDDRNDSQDDDYVPPNNQTGGGAVTVANGVRRSERAPKPVKMDEYVTHLASTSLREPMTVEEALSGDDAENWKCAMQEEYRSLIDNSTWTVTDLPSGRKPITCKWVFKIKSGPDGAIQRYKARLVARGCAQRKGIDYQETFSPVVRYPSIRFLIALAAEYDLEIDQMDAVTAFLHGELKEDIFMTQPQLFEDGTPRVCKLKKSLYGLKQASRVWNKKLDASLKNFGMTCSRVDSCIYYRVNGNEMLIVAVYVDDLMIFSNDSEMKNKLKQSLMNEFKMKDIGKAQYILGIRITRDSKSISIDQSQYIRDVLDKFGMSDCNPVTTPVDVNQKLTLDMSPKDEMDRREMSKVPYQEAVGSLLYAAQVTRPDIQFAVSSVSRYNNDPGKPHWLAVKRIMRFLKGTIDYKLTYRKGFMCDLKGFCDADWASDATDRRSTSGYVFMMSGAAISWCSKKQPTVALSTVEAEYMAMAVATQEALWLSALLNEITKDNDNKNCVTIYCDNKGAIQLAEGTAFSSRTKHIDIRHHFLKEKVAEQKVKFLYVCTDDMLADNLTKPVGAEKMKLCSSGINLK